VGDFEVEQTPEETMALELKQRESGRKQRFSVQEEVNMSHDVFARQMKDVEGLSAADNKFLRRFVGLMAVKGMACYKHGQRSRRKTLVKMDPQGTKVFWESKGKLPAAACIDLGAEAKDVVKGQVYSWFRSIAMDTECCISVVCHTPAAKGAKAKRLDLECESRDDATLLFAALSVLATARKPDVLKSQVDAEDVEADDV
jgi:tRNA threonylcarbamoyladenosine modification (KEOPS) complex  Pcc1 subunit